MARSRARARLNWVSQGQLWGRCRVRRRAERVIRPAREKNRRGGSWWSPPAHPDRSALSNGPGYAPSPVSPARRRWRRNGDGMWFSPTPYFRSRMAFSTSAWRRWSASSSRVSTSRSDEAVIAVRWSPVGNWGAATRRTMSRTDAAAHSGRGAGGLGRIGGAVHPYGMGVQSASGMAFRFRRLLCWRMVMEKRTSNWTRVHRSRCRPAPGVAGTAHPAHGLPQASRHQDVAGSGGDSQQRVIAPLAGIAVVACPFRPSQMVDRWESPGPALAIVRAPPGSPGPVEGDVATTAIPQEGAQRWLWHPLLAVAAGTRSASASSMQSPAARGPGQATSVVAPAPPTPRSR